jgi:hypothetical protein
MATRPVPSLLVSLTASTLAAVGAVAWLGRSDSAWVVVGALALLLALIALLGWQLAATVGARAPRYPRAASLLPGVAAVALLLPLGLVDAARSSVRPGSSPQGTVRGFLGAVLDTNGVSACSYLSGRVRLEFEGAARTAATCESHFAGATLRIGGQVIDSDGQLDGLDYSVAGAGASRRVTVSSGAGRLRFLLRPATAVERNAFSAPPTPWRIDSSVNGLG